MFPLYDENRPSKRPYVNYMLIIVNIAIFLLFLFQGRLREGIGNYGAIPICVLRGERLWTLFTSMFMHADLMHIAGNMLFLWVFGDNIEDTLGHGKYILFYLVGGLFASFAHIFSTLLSYFTSPIPYVIGELKAPSVGASGAISAVLGAYLLLFPHARIKTLIFYFFITITSVPAIYYLGIWFLYQLLMGIVSLTGLSSGIAFWAHIGGFVYGMILIKAFNVKPKKKAVAAGEERPIRPIVAPWTRTPLVDVSVDTDRVTILAEMPGVNAEDIILSVSEWGVTIVAEHGDIKYHGQIPLPVPVIPKAENLFFRNGVLSFMLYRAL